MLAWKLRITVLWTFGAVCQLAAMILFMFEPGAIRDLMDGEWLGANARSAGVQIILAVNLLGPMVMAFLTLVLKDAANRRTNAVVGSVAAVNVVFSLFGLLDGTFGAGVIVVALVEGLVALLVIWHAWKWPRPTEVTPPKPRQEPTRLGA
jgi:hypothetical protein